MSGEYARALERICRDLNLPRPGPYCQDWEWELPDEYRTPAHIERYLEKIGNPTYGAHEKVILMNVVLDSVNDLFERDAEDETGERLWPRVYQILEAERDTLEEVIRYWSIPENPLENSFAITARIRPLLRDAGSVA